VRLRHLQTLGLCVVVAIAVSVIGGTAAQAAEYGQCVTAKGHKHVSPKYEDSNCTVVATRSHRGEFVWIAGPPPNCVRQEHGLYADSDCTTKASKHGHFEKSAGASFTGEGGRVELSTAAGTIECKTNTSTGEITGTQTSLQRFVFTPCETQGERCQSSGEPEGQINTTELIGTLVAAGGTEVDTRFEPNEGGTVVEFDCTGIAFVRVSGQISAEIEPSDEMTTTTTETFREQIGQDWSDEFAAEPSFPPNETLTLPGEGKFTQSDAHLAGLEIKR
jgi:hypothetical protein